jgi:hypothetical protein
LSHFPSPNYNLDEVRIRLNSNSVNEESHHWGMDRELEEEIFVATMTRHRDFPEQ